LAALSEVFAGRSNHDVTRLLGPTADGKNDDERLRDATSFFYAAWQQIAGAHRRDDIRQSSSLDVEAIRVAQRAAVGAGSPRSLRTALDYLLLWAEVRQHLKDRQAGILKYSALLTRPNSMSELDARLQSCRSDLSTDYGFLMLQGLSRSLTDRNGAAASFRDAEAENAQFALNQPVDRFISTYMSDSEIEARVGEISVRRNTFMGSFELLHGVLPTDNRGAVLLFSCDPVFFSVFFPYWASAATYLREQGVHLHFILVGDRPKATTALEHGLDVISSVGRLRGFPSSSSFDNLSFSNVATMEDVAELRTLHACARFLVARELARRCPAPMLILDIDMEVNSDPEDGLRAVHEIPPGGLPVVVEPGLLTLVPGYRLPACKLLLPSDGHDGLVESFMTDVENYIYAGLPRTSSWLLDQTALDYATCRFVAAHGPNSLIEAGHCVSSFWQRPIGRLYKQYAAQKH
jgi:hypothetical protein